MAQGLLHLRALDSTAIKPAASAAVLKAIPPAGFGLDVLPGVRHCLYCIFLMTQQSRSDCHHHVIASDQVRALGCLLQCFFEQQTPSRSSEDAHIRNVHIRNVSPKTGGQMVTNWPQASLLAATEMTGVWCPAGFKAGFRIDYAVQPQVLPPVPSLQEGLTAASSILSSVFRR